MVIDAETYSTAAYHNYFRVGNISVMLVISDEKK